MVKISSAWLRYSSTSTATWTKLHVMYIGMKRNSREHVQVFRQVTMAKPYQFVIPYRASQNRTWVKSLIALRELDCIINYTL